jgi:hypothetical protein
MRHRFVIRVGGPAAIALAAALLFVGPTLALTPKGGGYSGTTAAGQPISFTVKAKGTKVGNMTVGYAAQCGGGSVTGTTTFSGTAKISKKGRFSFSGGSTQVAGKFKTRRKARGTTTFSQNIPFIGPCSTGPVSWTATK